MSIKLMQSIIANPHQLLYVKYNNQFENYNRMRTNILIYSLKSHYFALYKDYLLWDYIKDFFKQYYNKKESLIQIPVIYLYYKSYCIYFCRPLFRNIHFSSLLRNHSDDKAKAFYKQLYGSLKKSNKANTKNNDPLIIEAHDGINETNNSNKEIKVELNNELTTIFNTSARNIIDNNLLTTIDLLTNQSNNQEVLLSLCINNEEFFTIGAHNDYLINLLENIAHKHNNNNGLQMLTQVINNDSLKNSKKNSNNSIDNDNSFNSNKGINNKVSHFIKIDKSLFCKLYNNKYISIKSKPKTTYKKNTIFSTLNSTIQLFSLKYNSPLKFFQSTKSKPFNITKWKKHSFISKSNNITNERKPEHTLYNHKNYLRINTKLRRNLSIEPIYKYNNQDTFYTPSNNRVKYNMKECNKTKSPQRISKALQSAVATPDILMKYLHHSLHHMNNRNNNTIKHLKSKCNTNSIVRSLSNTKPIHFQMKSQSKPKSEDNNQQPLSNTNNTNTVQYIKNNKIKQFNGMKDDCNNKKYIQKNLKHLIKNIKLSPEKKDGNKKEANQRVAYELNHFYTNKHLTSVKYPTPTSPNIKKYISRNKYHFHSNNDKTKYTYHSIKLNISSNSISHILTQKRIKQNESTQTTTNTNQGNRTSKSPKTIKRVKRRKPSDITSNAFISNSNSNNNSKIIKSENQNQKTSPSNAILMFLSQRK